MLFSNLSRAVLCMCSSIALSQAKYSRYKKGGTRKFEAQAIKLFQFYMFSNKETKMQLSRVKEER